MEGLELMYCFPSINYYVYIIFALLAILCRKYCEDMDRKVERMLLEAGKLEAFVDGSYSPFEVEVKL